MGDRTRRDFLKDGLVLTAGAVASGVLGNTEVAEASTKGGGKKTSSSEGKSKRPNILMIMTDQQRQAQHWPDGWIEEHMPTMARLQDNGVTFTNNFTAATACSPSRATLLTGLYPSQHGVPNTPPNPPMRTDITNVFKLVEQAGYDVTYKGKMHLFQPQGTPATDNFSSYDVQWAADNYSFNGWNPPDCALNPGGDVWISGGLPNNDGRYVSGVPDEPNTMNPTVGDSKTALHYLDDHDPNSGKPFLMVCSFGNPHDISVWPDQEEWGYKKEDYTKLKEITLPPNYDDDLKEKPSGQKQFQKLTDKTDPCPTKQDRIEYCQFYAHLHTVVDKQIAALLDKLDEKELTDDTIIIRFADHGEQCWSHQMIQKGLNSYQETINVPLIISNPKLFPKGETTASFSSLVDLLPTIAELTGSASPDELASLGIHGKSLVPVMKDPKVKVRDNVMFFSEDFGHFFDEYLGMKDTFATVPGFIRSIRFEDWMYAVYFTEKGTKFEYELYNLKDDLGQMTNLAWGARQKANLPQMQKLHDMLTSELETYEAMPIGFKWPKKTGVVAA